MTGLPPRYEFSASNWVTPAAPTLAEPLYGASFGQAIGRYFKKYATFSGRASRSEYWFAQLFQLLVQAVLFGAETVAEYPDLGQLASASTSVSQASPLTLFLNIVTFAVFLGMIIPTLAVIIRRFHDSDHSGWYYLLGLVPFVGGIIVIIFLLLPPKPTGARFD